MAIKTTNSKHGLCRKDLEVKRKKAANHVCYICNICNTTGHEKIDHKVDKEKLKAEQCVLCKWFNKICIC